MNEIVHGGIDYGELARLGIDPARVLDFSVNGNPYGPSPRVREVLPQVDIAHYPDRHCLALRQAILDCELAGSGLAREHVLCGNGTAELIWAVARALLAPGATTAIIGPTFGEYAPACRSVGAGVTEIRPDPPELALGAFDIAARLRDERPSLVWLCNPNNPTGQYRDEAEQQHIARACREIGATLVVDEAYINFLVHPEPFPATTFIAREHIPDIIVLRSLTKDYALAGLRLGYLVASPATADRIAGHLPSWNVSAAAQAAGIAALHDRLHLRQTLAMLRDERQAFFAALTEAGFAFAPSQTHFSIIAVGDARAIRQRLLARGLLVRDCTSFGLPQHIRVATHPEWPRLLEALKQEAHNAADGSPLPRGKGGRPPGRRGAGQ
jgi:histidinol-phosphate aminotransferase